MIDLFKKEDPQVSVYFFHLFYVHIIFRPFTKTKFEFKTIQK